MILRIFLVSWRLCTTNMHIRLVICILDIAWHLRQQTIPVRVVQPLSGYDWWKKLIPPRNSLRFISFLLFSISSLFFFSICLEREKQKMWLSVGRHQDHLERKSESEKKKKKKLCLQMYEGHTEETEKQFQIGVEKVKAPFNLLLHFPSKIESR